MKDFDFVSFIYKVEIETEDINDVLIDKHFPDWENTEVSPHDRILTIHESESYWKGETSPISIEELERIIAELKRNQCTHTEIMWHTDHREFIFNGMEIRKASDEEIHGVKLAKEVEELKAKDDEIKRLEAQIKKIKES